MAKDVEPDDRARLETLRSRLEQVLGDPETPARDLASCSREYRQVIDALKQLTPVAGSKLDEIAERRRKRGAS